MYMTVKEALHQAIDAMSEEDAEALMDYLNLLADSDTLTDEEMAEVEAGRVAIERGDYITRDEFLKKYGIEL